MNTGRLNIYECSGLEIGTLSSIGLYHYWTAGTVDYINTRAFNEQLAAVNELMSEYECFVMPDKEAALIADEIDLHIAILQAMMWNTENESEYPLLLCGQVIDKMLHDGLFKYESVDSEERSRNLESLLQTMLDRIHGGDRSQVYDSEFLQYYSVHVIEENYNTLPEEAKRRLNDFFSTNREGIGDLLEDTMQLDPKDFDNLSDYIKACGPGFLYLWIDDIDKYSWRIRKRYKKEQEVFEYIYNSCAGIYTKEAVRMMMRCGIIESTKATPEKSIQELKINGNPSKYYKGGVGELVTLILGIITSVLTIVITVLSIIKENVKAKYSQPMDVDQGIPDGEDWGIAQDKEKESGGVFVWLLLAGVAVWALKRNNEQGFNVKR